MFKKSYYKVLLCCLFCSLASIGSMALPVSVDENVEFISAVCRIAGFREYIDNTNKAYAERIDSLMAPYKDHGAVEYFNKVGRNQGVGYDAVASLAVHTDIKDGHVVLKDGSDIALSDERWAEGQDKEIVALLDDLYQRSNFAEFYKSNSGYYNQAIANMNKLLEDCDLRWLNDFYGKELSGSRVVVSLLNRGNYGMTQHLKGKPDESVIIISCNNVDEKGYPVFHGQNSLIIHESSHPVCNPLVGANLNKFNNNIFLASVLMDDELAQQSYSGGQTMMCESMVRSMELQYALAHDNATAERFMKDQMSRGFIFMPEIREALDEYSKNRELYPVIDSIMPVIIDKINMVDVSKRYVEIKNGSPKIIGCSIAEGADCIEPSDSLEVRFFFDRPIQKGSFGMAYYKNNGDIMPELADVSPKIRLSDDGMVLTAFFKTEAGKEYGFSMFGAFYRSLKGYKGHGKVDVHFYTKLK